PSMPSWRGRTSGLVGARPSTRGRNRMTGSRQGCQGPDEWEGWVEGPDEPVVRRQEGPSFPLGQPDGEAIVDAEPSRGGDVECSLEQGQIGMEVRRGRQDIR